MPRMDDFRRLEAKGLARAKIRAKRRRVGAIRSRTIRGSLALFALAWAIVFGQLVTGNDPALSRSYRAAAKPIASAHRGQPTAPATPVELEPAPEPELEAEAEHASEPEVEVAPEPEPEVEPEPEPIVTSAS
jgi:hypothetical protein